jgi:hypothetical protein
VETLTKEYLAKVKKFTAKYPEFNELNNFIDQKFDEKFFKMARKIEKVYREHQKTMTE